MIFKAFWFFAVLMSSDLTFAQWHRGGISTNEKAPVIYPSAPAMHVKEKDHRGGPKGQQVPKERQLVLKDKDYYRVECANPKLRPHLATNKASEINVLACAEN